MTETTEAINEAFAAGVMAGRNAERKACWEEINKMIKSGPLQGNGCDESAQRNGLVMASNLIFNREQNP